MVKRITDMYEVNGIFLKIRRKVLDHTETYAWPVNMVPVKDTVVERSQWVDVCDRFQFSVEPVAESITERATDIEDYRVISKGSDECGRVKIVKLTFFVVERPAEQFTRLRRLP